jgi:hypothetical protein
MAGMAGIKLPTASEKAAAITAESSGITRTTARQIAFLRLTRFYVLS